ncbi:MAG: PQQ-binding-like beta-propeller repeat protein, partial [Planctomycetota bacterium]
MQCSVVSANPCGAVRPADVLRRPGLLRSVIAPALLLSLLLCTSSRPLQAQAVPADDVEQRGVLRAIEEVEEALRKESWLEAVQRFDDAWRLASEGEDVLLESRGAEIRQLPPGTADALAGGKARLNAVYRTAGPEFRRLYAEQFNETAAQLLRGLLERGETSRLKSVASRYQWTPAASQALQLLAQMHMDSGDFLEAGLLLERCLRFSDPAPPLLSLRTAWCFAKAGLFAEAEELSAAAKASVSPAEAPVEPRLQKLLTDLETLTLPATADPSVNRNDWLQPLGNYRRTQRQPPVSIRLAGQWKTSLLQLQDVLYADRLNPLLAEITGHLEQLWNNGVDRGVLELPAGQPLARGEQIFVRTAFSIQSWNSATGELLWEVARPDRALRETLENLPAAPAPDGAFQSEGPALAAAASGLAWQLHLQQIRGITAAQMAISGSTLFVVEETAAGGSELDGIPGMIRGMPTLPSNFIRAYDAATGLFLWEIGGQVQNAVPGQPGSSNLLAGYYFLGAPLVLGSRIYVLAENGEGVYLIRIGEPLAGGAKVNPQILASQLLTTPDRKLAEHPLRRYAGLMPTYARGLLICPTCDNRVVAVSAEDLSIRWVARYAGILQRQEIGDGNAMVLRGAPDGQRTIAVDMENRWYDFQPRVVAGKVLLTPRDADQLLCIDLQTGQQLWKVPRGGYHAIAGTTDQQVLLARRRQVGALDLATGKSTWTTALRAGIVCGSGVFTGTLLQLPTSTPALVSIDVSDGQVLASQPWSGDVQSGNLLSLPGGTLVQGITALTWLPRVTQDLQPIELATRHLLAGDVAAGRAVLETQLQQQPGDQTVRMVLIDLLLNQLRRESDDANLLIPQIEQLLTQLAQEAELGPLLHALLGMTLPDAASLPGLLRTAGRQREEEFREILLQRDAAQSNDAPLNQLMPRLERMIRELPQAMLAAAPANGLERSQADVVASAIHGSLQQRSLPEQIELQTLLIPAAVTTAASMSPVQRLDFAAGLLRCGLPHAAAGVLDPADSNLEVGMNAAAVAELARLQNRIDLALEYAQLTAIQIPTAATPAQLAERLDNWHRSGARWQAWSTLRS